MGDTKLVEEVRDLDAELDELFARVQQYRKDVPAAVTQAAQQRIAELRETATHTDTNTDTNTDTAPASDEQRQLTAILEHLHQTFKHVTAQTNNATNELEQLEHMSIPTIEAAEKRIAKPESAIEVAIKTVRGCKNSGPRGVLQNIASNNQQTGTHSTVSNNEL